MSVYFERPLGIIQRQSKFSGREVGITHPDTQGYIKLAHNGDIMIMASPEVGIILSPSKSTIFLVANTLKVLTNEEDGLKWNLKCFNPHATTFSEPALVDPKKSATNLYDGIEDYME